MFARRGGIVCCVLCVLIGMKVAGCASSYTVRLEGFLSANLESALPRHTLG